MNTSSAALSRTRPRPLHGFLALAFNYKKKTFFFIRFLPAAGGSAFDVAPFQSKTRRDLFVSRLSNAEQVLLLETTVQFKVALTPVCGSLRSLRGAIDGVRLGGRGFTSDQWRWSQRLQENYKLLLLSPTNVYSLHMSARPRGG